MSSSALAGTLLTAAAAGPVVHLGIFIRGEWHLESPKIISSHLAVAGLAWWYLVRHHLGTIQEQVTLILLAFAVYVISLGSSIVTYRLFFHQLRHYPGPKLAAMSTFWKVLHCRKGKKFIALEDAHCRYGQIVRTGQPIIQTANLISDAVAIQRTQLLTMQGPNELAIFHPAAVEALDGPKSRTSRTDTFDVLQPMTSLLFTRVEEEHMAQRKIWGHATSTSGKSCRKQSPIHDLDCLQAIAEYLPRIQQQVNRLADLIAKHGSRPILLNDVMSWFAFDSMGEFIFDKDFGMMDTETWHQAIIQQRNALAFFGKFVDAVWLARLGFSFFPWFGGAREWLQMVKFCDEAMQKRMRVSSNEYRYGPLSNMHENLDRTAPNTETSPRGSSTTSQTQRI